MLGFRPNVTSVTQSRIILSLLCDVFGAVVECTSVNVSSSTTVGYQLKHLLRIQHKNNRSFFSELIGGRMICKHTSFKNQSKPLLSIFQYRVCFIHYMTEVNFNVHKIQYSTLDWFVIQLGLQLFAVCHLPDSLVEIFVSNIFPLSSARIILVY